LLIGREVCEAIDCRNPGSRAKISWIIGTVFINKLFQVMSWVPWGTRAVNSCAVGRAVWVFQFGDVFLMLGSIFASFVSTPADFLSIRINDHDPLARFELYRFLAYSDVFVDRRCETRIFEWCPADSGITFVGRRLKPGIGADGIRLRRAIARSASLQSVSVSSSKITLS
jgi:hypothetical protein